MRRVLLFPLGTFASCLLLSTAALAGKLNLDAYPMRVHIFQHTAHSHYYRRSLDEVDGEGRANLFENGEPHAFDFGYRCGDRMMNSMGYETYYARWKKPGKVLEILLPVMGKPGAAEPCDLEVALKNAAYYRHDGLVGEEPVAVYKEWMVKHQYDPEHGLNEPIKIAAPPTGAAPGANNP